LAQAIVNAALTQQVTYPPPPPTLCGYAINAARVAQKEWCVICSPHAEENSNPFNQNPPLTEVLFTQTIYKYTADIAPLTHSTTTTVQFGLDPQYSWNGYY
jgi:hypothetical protein